MTGLRKTTREMALEAMKTPPPGGYFVWDGVDEDDRPLTHEEMRAGIELAKKRGRPAGSGSKEQVAIRFDMNVLAAFRAGGPGWQTRMNNALKDWLKTHSPA
jgi:uncharacterized protein (DUF4415 family)